MLMRFAPRTEFAAELKTRVCEYLARQDDSAIQRRMLRKTAILLSWTAVSYVAFLVLPDGLLWPAATGLSMGLAAGAVGMGIMHDANHGAYPVSRRSSRMLGFSLDLLGGSSYIWRFQHNVNHHSFTNVVGADNDISIGALARLSPSQPLRGFHRWQQIYMWPLYALLQLSWAFWADWRDLIAGRIGDNPFPRPRGREAQLFWLGKALWAGLWFGVPLLFHGVGSVVVFGLVSYLVTGWVLGVVFQLAHVVEDVDFPTVDPDSPRTERDFAGHQVATTADFAPGNRVLGWYVSGLNYQVEHHLFPKVCHLHYPGIAPIVREVCERFGQPYHCHPRLVDALGSHYRWLRQMGRAPATCPARETGMC